MRAKQLSRLSILVAGVIVAGCDRPRHIVSYQIIEHGEVTRHGVAETHGMQNTTMRELQEKIADKGTYNASNIFIIAISRVP